MMVVMTDVARQQIRATARYIRGEFGERYREYFLNRVKEMRHYLIANPNLRPLEPLLSDRAISYRSVVVTKLNKMIYYIGDDTVIYVVAFWDVRRNPATLAASVR